MQHFKQLLFVSGLAGTLFLLSGQSGYAKFLQVTAQQVDASEIFELPSDLSTLSISASEVAPVPGTVVTTAASLQAEVDNGSSGYSTRFTAIASANAAFFRQPEVGLILGVGYNF